MKKGFYKKPQLKLVGTLNDQTTVKISTLIPLSVSG